MTVKPGATLRLQFLARVVRKECRHLATTDRRLFASAFTLAQASRLETDPDLAARAEAPRQRSQSWRTKRESGDLTCPYAIAVDNMGQSL